METTISEFRHSHVISLLHVGYHIAQLDADDRQSLLSKDVNQPLVLQATLT